MPKLDEYYAGMKLAGWRCTTATRSHKRFCGVCGKKMRFYHLRMSIHGDVYRRALLACKDCNRLDAMWEQLPLPFNSRLPPLSSRGDTA